MIKLTGRELGMLALLTLFWGLNWPVMKVGVRELEPMTFRGLSMVGGLMVLAVLIRAQGMSLRVPRREWAELSRIAFFNMTCWMILAMFGIKMLSSGKAAILGYTLPIWSAVWGIVLYRDNPGRRLGLGIVAALVGVVLLVSSELGRMAGRPAGTLCMLAAAAMWGIGTHLMRRRRMTTPIPVITFWCIAQALAVCAVVALAVERDSWTRLPNTAEWGAIVYNSVLIFGFAQIFWFKLATILPPVASGLSVMLIPVIGLFSGMYFLGEQPSWHDYLALGSILVAIATVLWPSGAQAPVSPSAEEPAQAASATPGSVPDEPAARAGS